MKLNDFNKEIENPEKYIDKKVKREIYKMIRKNFSYEYLVNEMAKRTMMTHLVVTWSRRYEESKKYCRKGLKQRNRERILERDNHTCKICGFKNGEGNGDRPLHIDHIIPLRYGGSNDNSNLQVLCSTCNLNKSGKIDVVQKKINNKNFWDIKLD